MRYCGKLTPVPGVSEVSADAIAQQAIGYSPLDGSTLPIFDGTTVADKSFLAGPTDTTGPVANLSAIASLTPGSIHDVYAYDTGAAVGLGFVAWPAPTKTQVWGVPVNAAAITLQTDSGPVSVDALKATYLGTVQISDAAGTVTCRTSYGPGEWGVYNAHRQKQIEIIVGDTTWHWESQYWPTWRVPFSNPATKARIVHGQPSAVSVLYIQDAWLQISAGYSAQFFASIGWNNNTAPDTEAFWSAGDFENYVGPGFLGGGWRYPTMLTKHGVIGANVIYPLCKTQGNTGANAPNSTSCVYVAAQQPNMQMRVSWSG